MGWTVDFHKKAMDEFKDLPKSFKEDFVALFRKIRTGGIDNISRNDFSYMGDGIYELRVRNRDGIARSLYVSKAGNEIKILVVFVKKTQKTPMDKIELAKRRKDD